MTSDNEKFARLGRPRNIWAVSAIHAEVDRLAALHDHLGPRLQPGDRLVYLGNLLGRGRFVMETVEELLSFRRALLAMPGMLVTDIVYLRGAQEEMWQKLLQLQFAPNPVEVLRWMLTQGVAATLEGYGGDAQDGMIAARDGAVQLTRWTNRLREAMRVAPGHNNLFAALRRAAFTDDNGVLLVSAGIDGTRPLAAQGDSFWWDSAGFASLVHPYEGFRRIVRGFDPAQNGVAVGDLTATLDGGCGRNGKLVAGCIDPTGQILEILEV
ncbi:MAG TPA: hypothetical protein VFO41_17120 [Alphaproteobacteria bacterium]|nr:hypothetical protein [Alphaproteobacteria bacterium]